MSVLYLLCILYTGNTRICDTRVRNSFSLLVQYTVKYIYNASVSSLAIFFLSPRYLSQRFHMPDICIYYLSISISVYTPTSISLASLHPLYLSPQLSLLPLYISTPANSPYSI